MDRPNVIFMLADDLGWRDLGCYGSAFYETPHLDRLAAEGMRFTDAYAACPVCSPTRASILTGRYPATVGVTDWIDWSGRLHPARGRLVDAPYTRHLPHAETTVAAALAAAGYATWHVGKWHLGGGEHAPETHGFQVNVGGSHLGAPWRGYFSPWEIPRLEDGPPGEHLDDRLTGEAIRLIQANDGRPFYLNLCFYSVHTPLQAKPEKVDKYRQKARDAGLDTIPALEEGDPFPARHKQHLCIQRRRLQSDPVYAAMVETLDDNIGRLLAALEEAGRAENTLIVFTSDNGGLATSEGSPTCNAPLAEGKGWMYEGGTREPLLVRWPGVVGPARRCSIPVISPDFFPTLLAAAGLDPDPEGRVEGASLLPLLRGQGDLEREAIYWHYPHYGNQGGTPGSSVRCGDHKLIEFFEDGRLELYDLEADVGEEHNLAGEYPKKTEELHERLQAWRARVEAKIPQRAPDFGG